MLLSLYGIVFPEKDALAKQAKQLSYNTEDAFDLSILLLVFSQLGHSIYYWQILQSLNAAMTKLGAEGQSPSKLAWLFGRMLHASSGMVDDDAKREAYASLSAMLAAKSTPNDVFSGWAWGYFAAYGSAEYQQAKPHMKAAADMAMVSYASANEKQAARSAALWSQILCVQAAAKAGDKAIYEHALWAMTAISLRPTIGGALAVGLKCTPESSDYPAWALAIVRHAAFLMKDEVLFAELEAPVQNAIIEAEHTNATFDVLLAKSSNQLTIECKKEAAWIAVQKEAEAKAQLEATRQAGLVKLRKSQQRRSWSPGLLAPVLEEKSGSMPAIPEESITVRGCLRRSL